MPRWARTVSIVVVFVIAFAYTLLACGEDDPGTGRGSRRAEASSRSSLADVHAPELRNATWPTKNGPILAMNSDVCLVLRMACTRCESG
jgi:hypothetical protein